MFRDIGPFLTVCIWIFSDYISLGILPTPTVKDHIQKKTKDEMENGFIELFIGIRLSQSTLHYPFSTKPGALK